MLSKALKTKVAKIFVCTPLYPYFLIVRNKKVKKILKQFAKGRIVDIGCGEAKYKSFCLKLEGISSYIGIDYPMWKHNIERVKIITERLSTISGILIPSPNIDVSIWSDGTNLGLKSNSFATVTSFDVLEHIKNPDAYLSEARRVLKKGGFFIMTIPFLYQSHGGEDCKDDFSRWTKYGLISKLEENGFNDITVFTNGGAGVMLSQLINSYFIKKIDIWNPHKKNYYKILKFVMLMPIFFAVNFFCWGLEKVDNEHAYAASFCAVAKK